MGYEVVQLEGNSEWEDEQGVRRPVIQTRYKCNDLAGAARELVIQWAKWICNDDKIRNLENSTQFREEFSRNILPKFTNYTNKTTPLVFAERCKQLYLDNDGPNRRVPCPCKVALTFESNS